MKRKSKATHPEVCDAGTEIASDLGSMTNSPKGPTFLHPPAHSNHPVETFLKGMHPLLPSGAPATPGKIPKSASFLTGMQGGIWLRLG